MNAPYKVCKSCHHSVVTDHSLHFCFYLAGVCFLLTGIVLVAWPHRHKHARAQSLLPSSSLYKYRNLVYFLNALLLHSSSQGTSVNTCCFVSAVDFSLRMQYFEAIDLAQSSTLAISTQSLKFHPVSKI